MTRVSLKGWSPGPNANWQRVGAATINRSIRAAAVTKKRITLSDKEAKALATEVTERGGFTYNVPGRYERIKGFAVSIYPQWENPIPVADFDDDDLEAYVKAHAESLNQPDHYLGLWNNPEDGNVYEDVSVAFSGLSDAVRQAWKHEQLSVYDLGEGVEIPTGKRNGAYRRLPVKGVR